jgi:hypothetical protein
MKKQCNRSIEEKEGWSAGPEESNPVYRWTGGSNQSVNGQPENRPMERKKAVIKEIRQRQRTAEASQSTIGNGSESVLGEFDSCVSLFLFLVVFVFFRCK